MNVISLDQICKNLLLKRRYSMHWYLDFLIPSKDCLRELTFDLPIQTLRYKVLQLNDNHAVEIPNDYVDYAKVSIRVGQYLRPLIEDGTLDLVPNYDSDFVIQPYNTGIATQPTITSTTYYNGYFSPLWYTVNWNAFGENTGRLFGGSGVQSDTFKVNKARNEIKINENLCVSEVVLEYIGNGMDADSATHIDAYCQQAIEAYCMWQFKENNRTYGINEAALAKQEYVDQRKILTARLSDLTIDRFKRIAQHASIGIKY